MVWQATILHLSKLTFNIANTVERYADDLKRISDQIEQMETITKVTFFIRC